MAELADQFLINPGQFLFFVSGLGHNAVKFLS